MLLSFLLILSLSLCASSPLGRGFSVSCGGTFDPVPPNLEREREGNAQKELDCADWFDLGYDLNREQRYKESYDTLRAYVYSCHTPWLNRPAFALIDAAVGYMSLDNNRWLEHRNWLKSVLYLNQTDEEYYCAVARSILTTFQYRGPERGKDCNGAISVIDYLLQSGKCLQDSTYLYNTRENLRYEQILQYFDTVQNQSETPIDTNNVSLFEIGMEILLGPEYAVANTRTLADLDVTFTPNPFYGTGAVHVTTGTGISARVELYDMPGNRVPDLGSRWLGEGSHEIPIDERSIEAGSYYLRLSTSTGGVKTVKVIKQ